MLERRAKALCILGIDQRELLILLFSFLLLEACGSMVPNRFGLGRLKRRWGPGTQFQSGSEVVGNNETDGSSLTINSVESTTPKIRQAARSATSWEDGSREQEAGVRSSLFGETGTPMADEGDFVQPLSTVQMVDSVRSVNVASNTSSQQQSSECLRASRTAFVAQETGALHPSGSGPFEFSKRAKLQANEDGRFADTTIPNSTAYPAGGDTRSSAAGSAGRLPILAPRNPPGPSAEVSRLMPFGKYKGRPLSALPPQYLCWLRSSVPGWSVTEKLLSGRDQPPSAETPPAQEAEAEDGSVVALFARWGLPRRVGEAYGRMGIVRFFEWQRECLETTGALTGARNLVYSAPTSGGKTMVAEVGGEKEPNGRGEQDEEKEETLETKGRPCGSQTALRMNLRLGRTLCHSPSQPAVRASG